MARILWLSVVVFGSLSTAAFSQVRLGIDVLLNERIALVSGKRVGLVTNPSGVDGDLVPTADRLARDPRVKLVQLYGPEHGIRGAVSAGDSVKDSRDPETGIPVESLYGRNRRPKKESLSRLDVLLFDIQDVGSRTYTYASTLGEVMKGCAESGTPLVVLDRPNPLGGELFEGPLVQKQWKSFIGWGPTPVTHGMTFGELARFYKRELKIDCPLEIVKMQGWRRKMVWEDTGLTWVQTSPHIPHALQAHLYVATGMIGGIVKNVNEGVGYTLPFETIAAEFIEPGRFCSALRKQKLPGVRFRPISYKPSYFKFSGQLLHGVQILPDDYHSFRPLRTALTILCVLEKLYPGQVEYKGGRNFGIHWGRMDILKRIRKGWKPAAIEKAWSPELSDFAARRKAALLYR